jgi:hypothetical protein
MFSSVVLWLIVRVLVSKIVTAKQWHGNQLCDQRLNPIDLNANSVNRFKLFSYRNLWWTSFSHLIWQNHLKYDPLFCSFCINLIWFLFVYCLLPGQGSYHYESTGVCAQAEWTLTHTSHKATEQSTIEATMTLDGVTRTDSLIRYHRMNDL